MLREEEEVIGRGMENLVEEVRGGKIKFEGKGEMMMMRERGLRQVKGRGGDDSKGDGKLSERGKGREEEV